MNIRAIKFNKYHVTNGVIKSRVFYSLDNRSDGKKCVTIYARDYDRSLGKIFGSDYKNDTDLMTDYFDEGNVTLFEDHQLYEKALKRAVEIENDRKKRRAAQINGRK